MLHHIENPTKVLDNLYSLLKDNGELLILETNILNPISWLGIIGKEHEMRAVLNTQQNILNWLKKSKFSTYNVTPTATFTPAGIKILYPLLDFVDIVISKIPVFKKICALWLIKAKK